MNFLIEIYKLIDTNMKTTDAIELFGSGRRLAIALNISDRAVYQWGEEVPRLRMYEIKEVWVARIKRDMEKLNIILADIKNMTQTLLAASEL